VGNFKFGYYTTVSDRVTFMIHDIQGRVVAKLTDMDMAPGIYSAIWDGKGSDSQKAPPGIYFARVCTSMASDIQKITVTQ
jgi:flagellar hook assembly protein FlgD